MHPESPARAAPDARLPPLPDLPEGPGAPRRVGVELEFGALPPERAALIAGDVLGGGLTRLSAGEWRLHDSALGTVKIYLDTALRPEGSDAAAEAGVALARQVVPIEIVTEPVAQADLARLDALVAALAAAGAEGSRAHMLHGFGLHLNIALADPESGRDMPRIARAFALLEPWLRARDPLDMSRRVLPFTQPFPRAFGDALARLAPDAAPEALFDLIDAHLDSRNHGLDLLPAYAHLAPGRFARHAAAGGPVSARPAYHFRMPESRIDETGWSLGYDWRRWVLVERVAADDALGAKLADLRANQPAWPALFDGRATVDAVTAALGPLADLAPEAPGRA